jgi:hypothetical protein
MSMKKTISPGPKKKLEISNTSMFKHQTLTIGCDLTRSTKILAKKGASEREKKRETCFEHVIT